MDTSKEVKKDQTSASGSEGVKTDGAPVAPQEPSVDYEQEFHALFDVHEQTVQEKEQAERDRDNYKKGMLAAKGKKSAGDEEVTEPEDIETIVSRKVSEALKLKEQEATRQREKDLVAKLIKENKELKIARANNSQIGSGSPSATPSEGPTVQTDKFFSAEQLAYLKSRKLDPEKVKANMLKNKAI